MSITAKTLLGILASLACAWACSADPAAAALTPQSVAGAPQAQVPAAPRIRFQTNDFDFGRLRSGDVADCTFVFTNLGNATLEITGVQPQCGCTTAGDWSRRVDPGQTGKIPLRFNSHGYASAPVYKTVTVFCNDKTQPQIFLHLQGVIWKPVDLIPALAIISAAPDAQEASTSVRITNNLSEPIVLTEVRLDNPAYQLELQTNVPGRSFTLKVTAVPPLTAGTGTAHVYFKTSSTNCPSGVATIVANIQAAITVSPLQVSIGQAPLPRTCTNSFVIQNHSTNALALSEPTINATNIGITVSEVQKGRLFSVLVGFPAGFDADGQSLLITFKTSNSRFPVLKVPVAQAPRRNQPAPAPASTQAAMPRLVPPKSLTR